MNAIGRTSSDSRMRVLHVLPWVRTGGVERRRLLLAERLGEGFDQRVACLSGSGDIFDSLQDGGVAVTEIGGDRSGVWDPVAHLKLHRLIREWRPHIVHGAVFEGMVMGGLAGLFQRTPVVLIEETALPSVEAPKSQRRSPAIQALIREVARRGSGVVAVGPPIADFLRGPQRIPASKVHLVLNGVAEFDVAPDHEARAERAALGIPEEAFVYGTAARIKDGHKRITDLLAATQLLARDGRDDFHCLVVGDGPDLAMLRAKAQQLGVADRVTFAGHREDREVFFAMMDAFVLPSATEAASLALMEAMLAGLPCISTRVGSAEYVTQNGRFGRLVPPRRPDLIAQELRRLREAPGEARRLAEAARRHASEHLTATRYVRDLRDLYCQLLEQSGVALPSTFHA